MGTSVPIKELVQLCAVDDRLFAKTFFPQAARQPSPPMHGAVDEKLNDPRARLLNLLLPRDFAKTTKLRIFTAKRVAYGLSRTILYVGASEGHATRSIQWIRSRIEAKRGADGVAAPELFAQVFGLRPGKKWTDTELEIFHGTDQRPIWILGAGITGNIRGINFDDYRPDLIVLDDILTDENGASKEQRDKIADLVMGALRNSLAPSTENPNAKLAMLNTPQSADDVSSRAEKDREWITVRYSCWTKETEDLPVEQQVSAWPERHPTETLRGEKRAAVAANRLSVFVREKEVRIVSRENCMFRGEWLQYYSDEPKSGITVLAIDPVPPPSPAQEKKKDVLSTDFEAQSVWRRYGDKFYLLEYALMRGHQPGWTLAKFFELATRWRVNQVSVEGAAYQKVLKWILEQEMTRRQQWFTVNTFDDLRSKPVRINSILAGPSSNGRICVRPEHGEFVSQFSEYPNTEHEDLLDSSAIAVAALSKPWMDVVDEKGFIDNKNVPRLRLVRGCP